MKLSARNRRALGVVLRARPAREREIWGPRRSLVLSAFPKPRQRRCRGKLRTVSRESDEWSRECECGRQEGSTGDQGTNTRGPGRGDQGRRAPGHRGPGNRGPGKTRGPELCLFVFSFALQASRVTRCRCFLRDSGSYIKVRNLRQGPRSFRHSVINTWMVSVRVMMMTQRR